MNILHLQFDTEIRTIYEIQGVNESGNSIHNFLAFAGRNYSDKFGFGEELFEGICKLKEVSLFSIFFPGFSSSVLSNIKTLKSFVEENKIDIIHVHKRTDLQLYIALKVGKPVIVDIHDTVCLMENTIFGTSGHPLFRFPIIGKIFGMVFLYGLKNLESKLLPNANSFICVSLEMKKQLQNANLVVDDSTIVLCNTVPLSYIKEHKNLSRSSKVRMILGSSFSLSPESKSHRDISPLIKLIANCDECILDIYGQEFGESTKNEFKSCLPNNINIYSFVAPDNYLNVIDEYDVGLIFNNPHYDRKIGEMSLPKKLFEYASRGLPILAYDSKEVTRFVLEHEMGEIFYELTNESFKKALDKLILNYDLYSYNCINTIKNNYNWKKQGEILIDMYKIITNT